jgi:transposase
MNVKTIKQKYKLLKCVLNERSKRRFAAVEAMSIGRGGIQIVSLATGLNRNTIGRGIKELSNKKEMSPERVRRSGVGRKKIKDNNPRLVEDLRCLLEPHTRGDPESPLLWTTKSVRNLSKELKKRKYEISYQIVAEILHEMKYSLQSNRKTNEGMSHPDRNTQFEYINSKVKLQQRKKYPVISVDAKKKELVGNFKNSGREWRKKEDPEEVRVHDFIIKELGKVCPYGVYDLVENKGWVNLGIDHDTASFAVESIRQWWKRMGRKQYSKAKTLLITADAGGSNAARSRLWKWELQRLSNQISKPISVCHFPPGTSKWNKIEHKMFSFISKNWRAKPLISHEVIINLISSTKTEKGLKIKCRLDKNKYPIGIRISDKDMEKINLKRDKFHGEWNYTIHPNK